MVMEQLGFVSLQCLRRTCRIFLRLFLAEPFCAWRDDAEAAPIGRLDPPCPAPYSVSWRPFQPWPRAQRCPPTTGVRKLLEKDATEALCSDCRKDEAKWDWTWYYSLNNRVEDPKGCRCSDCRSISKDWKRCTECRQDHNPACFSRAQRSLPVPRRCIGREGYVRLCAYQVVRWRDVIGVAKRSPKPEANRPLRRVVIVECRHPSHLPAHHRNLLTQADTSGMHPTAAVERGSDGEITMSMTWTGHLPLPNRRTGKMSLAGTRSCLRYRRC